MLVLSSPSGAGKTTLTRLLREKEPSLTLSVSVTTRPRRPSEVEGVHYRFIDVEDFAAMRDRGELLEWAEVHGNFYGSPRREIDRSLAAGQDILFDIDYQGAQQIRGQRGGRRRQRLHPAALDPGDEAAAGAARRGSAGDDRAAHAHGARRTRTLARIRLRARQRRSGSAASSGCRRSWSPSGCGASASSGLPAFVDGLMSTFAADLVAAAASLVAAAMRWRERRSPRPERFRRGPSGRGPPPRATGRCRSPAA